MVDRANEEQGPYKPHALSRGILAVEFGHTYKGTWNEDLKDQNSDYFKKAAMDYKSLYGRILNGKLTFF